MDFRFTIYTAVALFLSMVDICFAFKAFRKPDKVGRAMGWSAAFAGVITAFYLFSVLTKNERLISVFSTVTFVGIDCLLVSLAYFAFLLTGIFAEKVSKVTNTLLRLLAVVDIGMMIVNIFNGAAVTFEALQPYGITYHMKTPYVIHLMFTYSMVAVVLTVLIHKSVETPRQYRRQYLLIIAAVGVVVLINAAFLFQDRNSFFTRVDCSTFGYSIGLYLMYWTAYEYREKDMLNLLSRMVVDSVEQGIVLFDYEDRLIMRNLRAVQLLGGARLDKEMPAAEFRGAIGVAADGGEDFSAQCDVEGGVPLRCDYRKLQGERGSAIGSLYVFTDISREKDITTGFEYAKDFHYVRENAALFPDPTTVAVFDIVGLSKVNRGRGRDVGDRLIRSLAKRVRRYMPGEATFLRGFEAMLIALCPGSTEAQMAQSVARVVDGGDFEVTFGLCSTGEMSLPQALEMAYRSIQMKKLLNPDSSRSQALSSLVRALKEADADTEDHVRRTQRIGRLLGERIHLGDLELTELELLCLLHDIGKVGVPLEILNKPGRLTEGEWAVLQTHPDKGYQIAMSSDELKPIAPMVRYHHERWDGRGYPEGLKGEEIPVLSRIIAIVDAYDAMVNDRSYRKALTPERAQREIRDNAGTQFDPVLAEEFLKLLEERPELAKGEKVGARDEKGDVDLEMGFEGTGYTVPIPYSRYLLDDNDRIIEVDDRFEELTGYSAADAVGRMYQIELVPFEDRAYYMLQVGNQFAGGNMAYLRHDIRRKNGEKIRVACYGKRFYDSAAKSQRNEIIIFRL